MIRSGNPALKGNVFTLPTTGAFGGIQETMTVQGTANKSLFLMALVTLGAFFSWRQFFGGNIDLVNPLMLGGAIGGFIVAMITIFKKTWAPVTAPIYALLEGVFLGGISATFEMRMPGIVLQAVGLTMAVFVGLLFAYKSRLIQVTEKFRMGVFALTAGIGIFYLVTMVVGMFGVSMPFLHQGTPLGIGISLVISAVAAMNLVMDFDYIESGERARAPKYLEWYGAFGLLVTLVWLYIELLRLLSKLQSRN